MVSVTIADADKKTQEDILIEVNQEVEKFSEWLSNLDDIRAKGALNNPEKALVRTYLMQKLQGRL